MKRFYLLLVAVFLAVPVVRAQSVVDSERYETMPNEWRLNRSLSPSVAKLQVNSDLKELGDFVPGSFNIEDTSYKSTSIMATLNVTAERGRFFGLGRTTLGQNASTYLPRYDVDPPENESVDLQARGFVRVGRKGYLLLGGGFDLSETWISDGWQDTTVWKMVVSAGFSRPGYVLVFDVPVETSFGGARDMKTTNFANVLFGVNVAEHIFLNIEVRDELFVLEDKISVRHAGERPAEVEGERYAIGIGYRW